MSFEKEQSEALPAERASSTVPGILTNGEEEIRALKRKVAQLEAENERLKRTIAMVHDLATYDIEEREYEEPSEDEMIDALVNIHELTHPLRRE